jgi:hypothetical protein
MNNQRTLAERGFKLPAAAPCNQGGRWSGQGQWRAHNLRLVIRDFLAPNLMGSHVPKRGAQDDTVSELIDICARADGFAVGERMSMKIAYAWQNVASAQCLAAWLGIPVEQIWPHHAQASARPVRAWREAPAAALQTEIKDEAKATLIAPTYIAPNKPCRQFVHTVPNRVNRRSALAIGMVIGAAIIAIAPRIFGGAQ